MVGVFVLRSHGRDHEARAASLDGDGEVYLVVGGGFQCMLAITLATQAVMCHWMWLRCGGNLTDLGSRSDEDNTPARGFLPIHRIWSLQSGVLVGGGRWWVEGPVELLADGGGHDDNYDAVVVVSLLGGFIEVPPNTILLLRSCESPCSWFER
jgi:hypothetical protein